MVAAGAGSRRRFLSTDPAMITQFGDPFRRLEKLWAYAGKSIVNE
jgi:hypothetical protein